MKTEPDPDRIVGAVRGNVNIILYLWWLLLLLDALIVGQIRKRLAGCFSDARYCVDGITLSQLTWRRSCEIATTKSFVAMERLGLVLYTGRETLPFGPDLWALPISALGIGS